MPAVSQCAHWSAQLQANTHLRLRGMDDPPPPPPSSSSIRSVSSDPGPRITVQWGKEDALTDILVDHITSHPADSCILFYSKGKKMASTDGEQASGKDKSNIYVVLAKLIFANHAKYGTGTIRIQRNFAIYLKVRYKKLKARLGATGAGILPVEICAEWKWFVDLDGICHLSPVFAVVSHSLRLGVDHTGQMYALVQPSCGATAGGTLRHAPGATQPQPQPQPQPQTSCSMSTQSLGSNPLIDPCLLQPSPPLPDTPSPTGPDAHLHSLSCTDDLHHSDPFASPLGDALDHLQDNVMMQEGEEDDDDLMQDDMMGYNSPLKVAGKKWCSFVLPLPSPPPDPQPFHMPTKAPTNPYHSHAAFGQLPIQGHYKLLSMLCNLLTPSSTTCNMTPSSSSTSQTLVSAQLDSGKKKKKAKSDVQDQVENLMEELESIQSDIMSLWDSKYQWFIVKLLVKSENQWETKKYNWLCDTCAHEASQAVLTH
ncbi:uncharacterized protein BJ212DRAFT_1482688 [Suillus subaureus]|uniref:Uncharacterized protein n=1 Tax=Suillus subaureus TaxID=48587 RepID=A0A9P7E7S2_9AGAM|nr:uncharacterized protein BJ212DRAFT_1482688 [Suillus subaureus]KAG1813218.1 hypothetical protein BJ212DRAFT_1482688 [Suillus subaureus]